MFFLNIMQLLLKIFAQFLIFKLINLSIFFKINLFNKKTQEIEFFQD